MARGRRFLGHVVLVLVVMTAAFAGARLGLLGTREVGASHNFNDVPPGVFYHDFVQFLVDNGITSGCGGGRFCGEDPVTRGQMAVFLQRLAALTCLRREGNDVIFEGCNVHVRSGTGSDRRRRQRAGQPRRRVQRARHLVAPPDRLAQSGRRAVSQLLVLWRARGRREQHDIGSLRQRQRRREPHGQRHPGQHQRRRRQHGQQRVFHRQRWHRQHGQREQRDRQWGRRTLSDGTQRLGGGWPLPDSMREAPRRALPLQGMTRCRRSVHRARSSGNSARRRSPRRRSGPA